MKSEEKRAFWLDHINSYRSSNLPIQDWCNQNGVNVHALRRWITKFNKENNPKATTSKWLAVDVVDPSSSSKEYSRTSGIRISIGSACIDVESTFDPKALEMVIGILSRQC